ncbi:MAG: TolC family protein [Xanthomonadaceae bacterium]|nr:TolC family protein [Xanthomonadaceae bacterium]
MPVFPFCRAVRTARKRRYAWWLAPALACLLPVQSAFAQQADPSAPGADAASIRSWLLTHNFELRAQQAETEAAQAQVTVAGSLPNPVAGMALQGISPRHPSLFPANVGSTTYQLRQPLPLWGKRALARGIAEQNAVATDANRNATALSLLAQAEAAYVRYWHAGQALALLDDQLVLLRKVEEIAGVRYALGMAPQQDAIRAQVETSRVQGLRIALDDGGKEATMLLNLLLSRRPDATLQAPAGPPLLPVASPTLGAALARLEQGAHPALQAAQAQVQAAQDSLRLRQRERWPDISVGIGAMQRGNRIDGYELMLEVELPLQRRALHARERAARALQDAAQARAEATQTSLDGALGVAWTQWRSAQRQRQLLETTRIPQAEANFNSALASYQVGEVDFNALLDALTQWQDARLAQLDAQRDELLGAASVRALEGDTP